MENNQDLMKILDSIKNELKKTNEPTSDLMEAHAFLRDKVYELLQRRFTSSCHICSQDVGWFYKHGGGAVYCENCQSQYNTRRVVEAVLAKAKK